MTDAAWVNIKKLDNVWATISTNHPTIMHQLYSYMSVFADGYRFMPKYKAGVWDGKIHFMDRTGKFAIGLISHVYRFIEQDGIEITIDDELLKKDFIDVDVFLEIIDKWITDEMTPRDYQLDGALKGCMYKRGILEHATSAGKSMTMSIICMYCLLQKQASKILILVPSISLVEQLSSDFIEYGVPADWIGKYYGLQKDTEQCIIISTWQSMCRQPEMISEFDAIIGDEAHTQKGNVVRSIAEHATNATIRIGCTGTMPEEKSNKWLVESVFGPVIHQVSAKFLIDNEYAADIYVKIPFISHKEELKKSIKGLPYDEEKKWLENYEPRNKIITKIAEKHAEKDQNILILADHIDHIEKIVALCKNIPNAKVFKITGEVDAREREQMRHFANENKRVIIVATYGVFSTGISIKRLHTIIFASAGKSKIKVLQSIGRVMRLHKEKNGAILYDIGDDLHFSQKHLQHRLSIYEKSQFKLDMVEIKL